MSKPDIQQTVGGFVFTWVDQKVTIKVSRVRVHTSDGRVTGELIINNHEGVLYPQTSINFSADRTRNTLAKTLIERYKAHPWQEMMDQLGYHVQELARKGDPVLELWSNAPLESPKYILYPLLMENLVNVFFGPPMSGKTQMALLCAAIMQSQWRENPLGLTPANKETICLWLDYEADWATTRYNLSRIINGAGMKPMRLLYRRCHMPLADDIESLADWVQQMGATVVIIDSAAKASGGDIEKPESPARFFTALDQLGCTSLVLAHTSKGASEGRKSIYGSVFFEAYARSVWELQASLNGDEMTVGMWDNKANFRGKHDPLAFQLLYDTETITISTQDIKTVDDFMRHLSTATRIKRALADEPKSVKHLKEILSDVHVPTLYAELARMVKRHVLMKKNDLYILQDQDEES